MKTLYLIRHGKGVPRTDEAPDHQRKLSKTGEREVKALSRNLQHRDILPDLILCSPAERACQTAEIITRALACAPERLTLYEEGGIDNPERLLQLIRSQPDALNVLLVIGHHPALSDVAHAFVPYFDTMLRTSSAVGIQFACDTWATVSEDGARLLFYDFPARLQSHVAQHVRQMIGEHLKQFVRLFLKYQDDRLPGDLEKAIRRSSRRLAKALVEELQTSPMHAVPDDEPTPTGETSPAPVEQVAAAARPTPAKKRKRAAPPTEAGANADTTNA